jgi:hypothetical protein
MIEENPDSASIITAYAFHPRSDGRGHDLLSGDRNLGTVAVEDRELVIAYAKLFSESLRAEIRVTGGWRGK